MSDWGKQSPVCSAAHVTHSYRCKSLERHAQGWSAYSRSSDDLWPFGPCFGSAAWDSRDHGAFDARLTLNPNPSHHAP